MREVGNRKIRVDKKKDVKPTIRLGLKDAIYRLSYITQTTVKHTCERMVVYAIRDSEIIQRLSISFVRDIRINGTLFRGHVDNIRFERVERGSCERVHTRLSRPTYESVTTLAYALALNPTRVCAILIDICMHDFRFLNSYVTQYLGSSLSKSEMNELDAIVRYINNNLGSELTVASLLSAIVNEVNEPLNVKKSVDEFLVHNWRNKK